MLLFHSNIFPLPKYSNSPLFVPTCALFVHTYAFSSAYRLFPLFGATCAFHFPIFVLFDQPFRIYRSPLFPRYALFTTYSYPFVPLFVLTCAFFVPTCAHFCSHMCPFCSHACPFVPTSAPLVPICALFVFASALLVPIYAFSSA